MNELLNQLAFGWYPYLAITVLSVGSILRFDADQYSWRSQSSQPNTASSSCAAR